jgi:hypothetical protein
MMHSRIAILPVMTLAAWLPVAGQAVISTHSGIVYFFEGSVFVGDQPLEQKFGRSPEIGEGRDLRTAHGRAEVLLTPGVFLRVGENSAIRMLSNKLADTQVELLTGSAILESNDARKDNFVTVLYQNWLVRVPRQAVYRIDSDPPQLQVYKGDVEVSTTGKDAVVALKEGETLALAEILLPERTTTSGTDPFKNWAMSRSQTIAADNSTAAGIIDDPNQVDNTGVSVGGYTYFPPGPISSLGLNTPYGLSFWSPYQSALGSIYFSPYMYGVLYPGWPSASRYYPSRIAIPSVAPSRIGSTGLHPGSSITSPRAPYSPPSYSPPSHSPPSYSPPPIHIVPRSPAPAPHVGVGAGAARGVGHR